MLKFIARKLFNVKLILLMVTFVGLSVVVRMMRKKGNVANISERRALKQNQCQKVSQDETIFVSVASYRDPECPQTVFDCLEKASCPLRIVIGVCQQNYPIDVDVMDGYKKLSRKYGTGNYADQIRVLRLDAGQAQGPMYARSVIEQQLYRNEKYYLIIDSHTCFTENWDIKVIDMLKQCPADRSVLTMYPDDYQSRSSGAYTTWKTQPASYLRLKKFNAESGLPEFEGPACYHVGQKPLPSLFWGGCFSFARAEMIKEVPFDPYCPYVFLGEEISMAARLFTSGWNLYMPTEMLVKHMWTRRRPTFWEQFTGNSKIHLHRQNLEQQGYRRLRSLFNLQALEPEDFPLGQYGLGRYRTLDQFQQYCGINFLLEKAEPRAWVGCTAQPTPDEIMTKFGSINEYKSQLVSCI